MKNLKYLVFGFLATVFLFMNTNIAFAGIRISPNLIELNIPKKSAKRYLTGSFTVQAGKSETIRFKVYPEFFNISDRGRIVPVYENTNPACLVEKIRFTPNEFTLKDGKPQIVRFTVRNTDKLPDGESRTIIYIEDTKTKEIAVKTGQNGVGGKIIVKTRAAIPLYVDKPNYQKDAKLEAFALKETKEGLVYEASIKSLGNSKVRMAGKCQVFEDEKIIKEYTLENNAIQCGTTGRLVGKLDMPKIDKNKIYKVRFLGNYKNENSDTKYLTDTVILNEDTSKAGQI